MAVNFSVFTIIKKTHFVQIEFFFELDFLGKTKYISRWRGFQIERSWTTLSTGRDRIRSATLPQEPMIASITSPFICWSSNYFQESNPEPYANKDAVFTLCYAVIMLNVDQHNSNIKQQKPMTCEVQLLYNHCCIVVSYSRQHWQDQSNLRFLIDDIEYLPRLIRYLYFISRALFLCLHSLI